MNRRRTLAIAAAAAAVLVVVGAGAAIAATKVFSPKEESQAIVNDAAAQLGVEPSALSNALKKAFENRVDAAVAAGRLSKEEGEALKARIRSGEVPLFGGPRHGGFGHGHLGRGHFGGLDAAATYLGLTEAQLRAALRDGKTLAQVAKDKGKSVDGLVDAMVKAATKKLDEAVAAKRLTEAQKAKIVAGLKQRSTDLVNGKFPRPPDGGHFFGHRGPGPFGHDRFAPERSRS